MPSSSVGGAQCTCFCRPSPADAPARHRTLREAESHGRPKYTATWRSQLFANGSLSTLRITDFRRAWQAGAAAAVALASPAPQPPTSSSRASRTRSPPTCSPISTSTRSRATRRAGASSSSIAARRRGFATRCRRSGTTSRRSRRSSSFAEECWHARFTIAPGEPVRIRTLGVGLTGEARARPAVLAAALAEAGLAVGAALDHGAYERLKRRLADLGRERGYADAQFTASVIDVYPEQHAADIALQVRLGRALRLRPHRAHARRADGAARVVVPDVQRRRAVRRAPARRRLRGARRQRLLPHDRRAAAAGRPGDAHDSDRRRADERAAHDDELRHRLLDGHAAALSLRPQQPALQRPRAPVRHQRAALARRLGGHGRTTACR